MPQTRMTDETDSLVSIFPPEISQKLIELNHADLLIEIVFDLGRLPVARYAEYEAPLSESEVRREDIQHVLKQVGAFDADNRAGIARTLHRISAIYNRKKDVVGLTCRVGRAVYGMVDIIEDYLMGGKSVLILGKPGVGKTTMLREASRILAEKKRVIVVDTSNEIGGDGDVPHPAIGRARRMQVQNPARQHDTMIEAVENHNPQVIVIDEIGKEMEAAAARTIAERGVQLIATAHGHTLENLILNPTLSDLVGGVENVTLSDEEARLRGTQKSVRERKAPSTFDVLVEIVDFQTVIVHPDVAAAVDALLRGYSVSVEYRHMDDEGGLHKETREVEPQLPDKASKPATVRRPEKGGLTDADLLAPAPQVRKKSHGRGPMKVYTSGLNRKLLHKAIMQLGLPITLSATLKGVDALLITKSSREKNQLVLASESLSIPVHIVTSNTYQNICKSLEDLYC